MSLPKNPRRPSRKLTEEDAIKIWISIAEGQFANRIAAGLDCNPARIYDVLHRKKFSASQQKAAKRVEATNPALAEAIRAFQLKPPSLMPANDDQSDLFGSG